MRPPLITATTATTIGNVKNSIGSGGEGVGIGDGKGVCVGKGKNGSVLTK